MKQKTQQKNVDQRIAKLHLPNKLHSLKGIVTVYHRCEWCASLKPKKKKKYVKVNRIYSRKLPVFYLVFLFHPKQKQCRIASSVAAPKHRICMSKRMSVRYTHTHTHARTGTRTRRSCNSICFRFESNRLYGFVVPYC